MCWLLFQTLYEPEPSVLPVTLQGWYYHLPTFSKGETEAQRSRKLLVLETLIGNRQASNMSNLLSVLSSREPSKRSNPGYSTWPRDKQSHGHDHRACERVSPAGPRSAGCRLGFSLSGASGLKFWDSLPAINQVQGPYSHQSHASGPLPWPSESRLSHTPQRPSRALPGPWTSGFPESSHFQMEASQFPWPG